MDFLKPTTSIQWLFENIKNEDLIVLDASLPKPKTKAEDNPLANIQIPGARFFDIDHAFSNTSIDLPHMMPSSAHFEEEARKLGINKTSKIVVYDNLGVYSSPRAWWMFKAMGHVDVSVLDGGLPEWVESGFPTEAKTNHSTESGNFESNPTPGFFKDSKEILDTINDSEIMVLDARSRGRFEGVEPEPRAGLRGGHIPGSLSLPFPEVVNGNKLRDEDELKEKFEQMGISNQQLVFSCGSGLTACIIALAADVAGFDGLSVYDGSWSEWGQPSELPVVAEGG